MGIILSKYNCCDFSDIENIGVLCRGKSLGNIGKYKDNFKNIFVVGQHYKSFQIIGKHILGSNIVKLWGSTFNYPSREEKRQYVEYGIKDMQTYLNPIASDRKAYKFKKIQKRNSGFLDVYPIPINFFDRNKRFIKEGKRRRSHPTLGLFGVDIACAYRPKSVCIIGLDFYYADYLTKEKLHVGNNKNIERGTGMIDYFKMLCREESNIKFYLYTCCKTIKSRDNLDVIRV